MIIVRTVGPFLVSEHDTVRAALQKISDNQSRVVFCTGSGGSVTGVVTDGDVRRAMLDDPSFDPRDPVGSIANREFVKARADEDPISIERRINARILQVPLLDDHGRLVGVAMEGRARLEIAGRRIDDDSRPLVIAEIGNNHQGDLALARELVDAAVDAGVECVKFQLRDMASLYRSTDDSAEDLGAQYTLDLLAKFSFGPDQMREILGYCDRRGVIGMCTPWDEASVAALETMDVPAYKVASADLTNHDLLRTIAATGKPMIMSTGMSTEDEIIDAVKVLRRAGAPFALLHCNSTYPAPYTDINLAYLERLRALGECPVGYSGHERGINVATAAVALGARIIEKHLTVDRSLEGADHKVSLLPDELADLVVAVDQVDAAMGTNRARVVTQGESMNRVNLAKSLVAAGSLPVGHRLSASDVAVKSPGRGLQPDRISDLVGTVLTRKVEAGDFFFEGDLGTGTTGPREFRFRRPWGIPVRYHDVDAIRNRCELDLVEYHFSYRDLDLDPDQFLASEDKAQLVVHSPEMFEGDFLLDLASPDTATRNRSIRELQRVVTATRALRRWYPASDRPLIIVNVGGFTADHALDSDERAAGYERVANSFAVVDTAGVELIPQTMPPYPWLRGGQMLHNLFVDPVETAEFCRMHEIRICFDISHSKLAANHLGLSFRDATELLAPHTAHLHVVDAAGTDGEGLQVGEGEVDFAVLGEQLDRLAPDAGFIPEIWQGHVNEGEGFWVALDRLETWL